MSRVHRIRLLAFLGALAVVLLALGWTPGSAVTSLGEVLAGAVAPEAPEQPEEAGVSEPRRGGSFRRRNPFRIVRVHPPPAPPPTSQVPTQAARRAPPPKPKKSPPLPLRLLGTIAGDPLGVAFVRHLKDNQEFMVPLGGNLGTSLGEDWLGVVLTRVRREEAVFERAPERWVLKLNEEAKGGSEPVQAAAAPPPPQAQPPAAAPVTAPQRVVTRGDVEKNLKNLGFLITQLNVQPFFQNGKPSGFRVSRIRPGSFVDKMGARNGDVIRSVNGKPIRTIKDAFLLYNSFKSESSVQVEILRGGKATRLGYQIR